MAVQMNPNFQVLLDDNRRVREENNRLRSKIAELRKKTSFRVYEENLALIQEVETLKALLVGNQKN